MNEMLDDDTEALLEGYENQIYVSSVSVMEFTHLLQNGRITSKRRPIDNVLRFIEEELGFRVLYVSREHLMQFEQLPVVEGHNDPNDRMIIAQAINERMELISSDNAFRHYRRFGLQYVQAVKISHS